MTENENGPSDMSCNDETNVNSKIPIDADTDRSVHTAAFDERGDFGHKKGSSKTLVIATSDIVDPEAFSFIASRYPKNTRKFKSTKKVEDSLKFRTSSDGVRTSVVQEISDSNVYVYAITYSKKNFKDSEKKNSRVYRDLFEKLVDLLMKNTDAESFNVVIDRTNELGKNIGCDIVREVAKKNGKRIIDCKQVYSKDELVLQIHDFVLGSLGVYEEDGDSSYLKKLGRRIRRWIRGK